MSDSMTKDDVLSALGEISQHFENCAEATYGGNHEWFHRWMNAADWAAAYLNDPAPTIGGWISVKDRLPEAIPGTTSSAFVLVCYKTKCEITGDTFSVVTMSSFNTRCKEWHIRDPRSPHEIVKVTHWMPKPKPPEEVTGDD